ncbi:MAG TPA: glucose-6-phosphate dehydrogenase [Rhodopila sp.]|uniref:glucose-6-phosphate dehydrogenase n=1 Tax=Rhodopila sp. TaxID=2480087 RepID=UPI002B8E447F|nr:glucose-6-phosphate dehydrogenase [Rhodopila sp.]HVY15298.1 glucose-6-phosphate dehydrogenase [Rhodopila sp.]
MTDAQPTGEVLSAPPRRSAKPPGPCAMVIFGAGGDLTKRLLVPALYNLANTGLLPQAFALIGVDIADLDADRWRDSLHEMLESFVGRTSSESRIDHVDEDTWRRLTGQIAYIKGDFEDKATFQTIKSQIEQAHGTGGNCLFYLAVADRFFGPIATALGEAGLMEENWDPDGTRPEHWRRIVIEKPFGHDQASARTLNATILRAAEEHQIYRIDHFLGKETVQNIMALRFANGMFEPIWNRDRIDHVQITVAETVGVETRGRFYEKTGALRDMVPNHVFQLLAMVAMEPPGGFDAKAVRTRKSDVFAALRTVSPKDAVRGQYDSYRQEKDVAPDSNVETYVAMRLSIDNWRWAGVPFYLRTGKHMSRRITEIAIRFKPAPYAPFEDTNVAALPPNWLLLQIQPDEGIALQFEVKRPGPVVDLAAVQMAFKYADWFPKEPNIGYETLIYDVMIGDQTLFNRADMVEETWRAVAEVLDDWSKTKPASFPNYASGSDGPTDADELLARDGRSWRPIKG